MGLHNQISGSASDSILIFTVVFIAKSLRYLRSIFSTTLRAIGLLSAGHFRRTDDQRHDAVGSGLANLILLCEQLRFNRELSYPVPADSIDSDCIICLDRLGGGEKVRELACGHVFHRDCFAGWLDQLNFSCPICREPLALQVDGFGCTRRRVAGGRLSS